MGREGAASAGELGRAHDGREREDGDGGHNARSKRGVGKLQMHGDGGSGGVGMGSVGAVADIPPQA